MHILPFPGDELPPSALPHPPSPATSTLTLTRLLHGAVTAKRHALPSLSSPAQQSPQPPPPPAAAVPWQEDHAEEEEEPTTTTAPAPAPAPAGGYCPCFGGKVCPRENCEWRETLPGAASMGGRAGRVREEMVRALCEDIYISYTSAYLLSVIVSHTQPTPYPFRS